MASIPVYRDLEGKKTRAEPRKEPVPCWNCGVMLDPGRAKYGAKGWRSEGKPFCDECYEAEKDEMELEEESRRAYLERAEREGADLRKW